MNFLAHFYLSGDAEPLIVGNFLGDFLSNREVVALPADIQEGVRLHRQIDTFTDQHPMVHQSTARLREVHGKYAPVILDVLHDFVLANNWGRYSNVELSAFASGVYEVLRRHLPLMPGYLQERLPRMIADDWLVRYGTEEGLRFTFNRMKMRSSRPHFFENAVESLTKDYIDYEEAFHVFFPDVITTVNRLLLPT
ncbi:MAG: DUF479 domain-containing protein [Bacteroidetes bacterium]|nr:DUF479 domain-containing protein [Bacteroidota bacterium]